MQPELQERAWLLKEAGLNNYQIAADLGVGEASVRRLWKKGPSAPAPAPWENEGIDLSPAEAMTARELLAKRGIDYDDVLITKYSVRQWGDNEYLGVDSKPLNEFVRAARPEGLRFPKTKPRRPGKSPRVVALFGDHHAPHHDKKLHEAVVAWIEDFQPDEGIILGDLLDLDQVSRYRNQPEWTKTVQETVDSGYEILVNYRHASPTTSWQMLGGNHEDRLRNTLLDQVRDIYNVRRAQADGEYPVMSVPYLLRLDELGIDWIDPNGEYAHGQIKLSSELAARHGWLVKKGAGASALASIEALRHSIIIGHTHRQSIVHHTTHSIDGEPKSLLGCEAGTLAEIRGGLGYAVSPDWINGFAVATIWPDGTFHVELATYASGVLRFRDWSYRP